MGISKKYIREVFRNSEIQLTREALLLIEKRLKEAVQNVVFECESREFKRVTPIRLERVFKYEDLL